MSANGHPGYDSEIALGDGSGHTILSHRHRCIFIKTRRTAGTSIEVFLSQACGPEDVVTPIRPHVEPHRPRNHTGPFNPLPELLASHGRYLRSTWRELADRRRFFNHMPALKVRARVGKPLWDRYFTFCVERNPWDKTISHYYHTRQQRGEDLTFDDYLSAGRFPVDHHRYTDASGEVIVDRVVRYERLNAELGEIFATVGIAYPGRLDIWAKSAGRTDRTDYRLAYTPAQRDLVGRAFAVEIRLHGYTF